MFSAIFLLLAIWAFSGIALAENQPGVKTVITLGTEPIEEKSENIDVARTAAIENGLVAAVAGAAMELLPMDSIINNFQVFNDVIYGQTQTFIQGYKVLTELATKDSYRVMIEASISTTRLQKSMADAGMVLDKNALPKILFLVSEQGPDDAVPKYWWGKNPNASKLYAENALQETLQAKGFTVIDQQHLAKDTLLEDIYDKPDLDNQEALALGRQWSADVVIVGESVAIITPNTMGENVRSFKGTVSVRAIKIDSAVEIASTSQTFVTTNTDESLGSREALIKAGIAAGQELAAQIAALWQKDTGTGNFIEIIVEGTDNLANFVKFRRVIHDIPGVEQLQMKEMTSDRVTLVVDFRGTTEDLARALMLKPLDKIGINIYDISPNYLKIELISPG
jgi:hypothetical protein